MLRSLNGGGGLKTSIVPRPGDVMEMLTGVANLHQQLLSWVDCPGLFDGVASQRLSVKIWNWMTQCLSPQRRWIVTAGLNDKSKRGGDASHYSSADHHGLVLHHAYSVLGMRVLV